MDLLGPILAYFGTVTAMIIAVMMSYDAFVYMPAHSTIPQQFLALAAKPSAAKAAAKPAAKIARLGTAVAAPARGGAAGATARQTDAAVKRRAARVRNAIALQQQMRWLNRQARVREWAYQQAPDALGYADEPAGGFGYDRSR